MTYKKITFIIAIVVAIACFLLEDAGVITTKAQAVVSISALLLYAAIASTNKN